jgi:shikimate dehydrogenase
MRKFALIGKKLGHSYSQRWFEELFVRKGLQDHSYDLVEMPSLDGLREWVQREGICGFNVTVPYKQAIIPLLDELDETAAAIGAVNCVTVEEGRLVGHNADAPAFQLTVNNLQLTGDREAFILGTGGAARAVAYALGQLGIKYTFVSRHPEKHPDLESNIIGYSQFSIFNFQFSILINATPVGMYPAVDATPLDLLPRQPNSSFFTLHSSLVYDLIYNPSPTRLLREAALLGATTKDGLEMLHLQAEMSWALFRRT